MKNNLTSLAAAVCLSLSGLALTACTGETHDKESTVEAIPVIVGKVQKVQERETIAVSGTISTQNSPANVAFLVSGKVVFVGPREGESVKKGQILASIDPTDYRLNLTAAKALTDMAEVAFKRAEDEHRRMKLLFDSRSLAPNDFQRYQATYDSARQQYEQAAASEELALKHLADATLRAPTSGYIARRSIELGETAAAGQPAFEIVQMEPVEVNVGIPETDVHRVRIGQTAAITVPSLPGKSFEGTVRVINVAADPSTRTYMARIAVENPEHLLRVGMVAEAAIRGDRTIAMATLPGETVVRDPQGATQVFVYFPDQKRVYSKRVEIGAATGKDIEIKSGLVGDELIVLAGQGKIRNGVVVSATEQTRSN